jgi:hypothetical protein
MEELSGTNLKKWEHEIVALVGGETRHYFRREIFGELSEALVYGVPSENSRKDSHSLFDLLYFYDVERDGHKSHQPMWILEKEYNEWWPKPAAQMRLAFDAELLELKEKIERDEVLLVGRSKAQSLYRIKQCILKREQESQC